MEFTSQEEKLIRRLRQQDRRWAKTRWVALAMGIFSAVAGGCWGCFLYLLITQTGRDHFDPAIVFLMVMIWTKCCLLFIFSLWCFGTSIIKWHGDVNRMLLLKLLDDQQQKIVHQAGLLI